ncbi:MAG: anhydro-N-acetylmuramic acid kinase [Gammaproteobacteria bacterium]|nr:MAG: anhydro-N-acetylmuramic acid kinase [Gammaproteobacteria bacterium]
MNSESDLQSVIGLMSGTSVDGIDVALLWTNGRQVRPSGIGLTVPYADATRRGILDAIADPVAFLDGAGSAALSTRIAEDHAAAVEALVASLGKASSRPSLIGFHGHTILHAPDALEPRTVQLGDARRLADLVGIDVVADFRQADIRAGGQGAPLAPVYHQALLDAAAVELPAAIVNIGGIANITGCGEAGLVGFDCGPGNCIMDDLARHFGIGDCDPDGRIAATGTVDQNWLFRQLDHVWYRRAWPKSLDRQAFADAKESLRQASPEDALATALALTVEAIVLGLRQLPERPARVFVSGGGARNLTLMLRLQKALRQERISVDSAEALGTDGDFVEAELMAYLAARHVHDLPITWPATTGARRPTGGGRFFNAIRAGRPDEVVI